MARAQMGPDGPGPNGPRWPGPKLAQMARAQMGQDGPGPGWAKMARAQIGQDGLGPDGPRWPGPKWAKMAWAQMGQNGAHAKYLCGRMALPQGFPGHPQGEMDSKAVANPLDVPKSPKPTWEK